jgi:hypothetical protein
MTSRSLASSRYGKHHTSDHEHIGSRIRMIRGTMNLGGSNKKQYEKYDGISRIRKMHRPFSLRRCRNKNTTEITILRKDSVNNTIK